MQQQNDGTNSNASSGFFDQSLINALKIRAEDIRKKLPELNGIQDWNQLSPTSLGEWNGLLDFTFWNDKHGMSFRARLGKQPVSLSLVRKLPDFLANVASIYNGEHIPKVVAEALH